LYFFARRVLARRIPAFRGARQRYNARTYWHATSTTRRISLPSIEEANMGLQISARKSGAVTILDLQGRITIGASNDALSAELRKLAEAGPSNVVINLAGVMQMDSSGISTMVRAFVTLERQGGGLKILNPAGHVREVLELTRLINSIPTFTDEAKAVAAFRGGVKHA
jgi:anti-anti-sigma factor